MNNYPERIDQQFGFTCTEKDRQAVCGLFQQEVGTILMRSGLVVIDLPFRAKTRDSIAAKIARYKPEHRHLPLSDIFGIRAILNEEDIWTAVDLMNNYYHPPERYPWGLRSTLDHTDPANQSSRSHSDYKAVHMCVPFSVQLRLRQINDLGEIQLITPKWLLIASRTRVYFESQKKP